MSGLWTNTKLRLFKNTYFNSLMRKYVMFKEFVRSDKTEPPHMKSC